MRDLQSITDMQKTYLEKMLEPNSQFSIFLDVTAEAINWPEEFKGLSLNVNKFSGLIPKIAHFIIKFIKFMTQIYTNLAVLTGD